MPRKPKPKCILCGKPSTRVMGDGFEVCAKCYDQAMADAQPAPIPTPKGGKAPTAEQQEILKAAVANHRVLMIEAGAGTGKTTTLRMLADVMPGRGQYTAFNTSLVNDTKPKFQGTQVACNTTHSLAFRAIGKEYSHRLGGARIRSEDIARMLGIRELEIPFGEGKKRLAPGFMAGKVMDAIRRFCQSADTEIEANHFRYVDGIDMPVDEQRTYDNNNRMRQYLLPYARKAWDDLCSKDGQLAFSHDHYVKIWQLNKPVISADYILLDEAQDTAEVMLDILRQQTCKIILVGDSAQQIYEWRGAVNALASFPEAPRKFLSQSFRFGEAIAQVANAVLETLEEPTPLRLKGLPSIPSVVNIVDEPTAVLCRTNAVAVCTLLTKITEGKHPFLVGGGADVIAFVEAAKKLQALEPTSHPDLACFSSWSEVQEYSKMDEGEDLRLMVKLIDGFGVQPILDALKTMPMEKDADLVISTAHKSKGREWDKVVLANDFPTVSRCSDADRKLLYVAVTRAKLELDLTRCPFFTGEDSLDIEQMALDHPKPIETPGIMPAAPSTPPAAPEEFTWAKDKVTGKWVVRGRSGMSGEAVTVVRKDGSKSTKVLSTAVWSGDGVSLYRTL